VGAYGPIEFFDDLDRLLGVDTRLANLHKGLRAKPWAATDPSGSFIRAMLRGISGIIGLRLPIARPEGKRKMSRNRSAEDRAGVAMALAVSEDLSDRAAASLIPAWCLTGRHPSIHDNTHFTGISSSTGGKSWIPSTPSTQQRQNLSSVPTSRWTFISKISDTVQSKSLR
jgi:hypothetical protein